MLVTSSFSLPFIKDLTTLRTALAYSYTPYALIITHNIILSKIVARVKKNLKFI